MTTDPEYATPGQLAAAGHEYADVELSTGAKVQVRGLTRYEVIAMGRGTEDPAEVERNCLRYAVVKPAMTAKQVEAWQKSAKPTDIGRVNTRIRELSGLTEGAAKSDVVEIRD